MKYLKITLEDDGTVHTELSGIIKIEALGLLQICNKALLDGIKEIPSNTETVKNSDKIQLPERWYIKIDTKNPIHEILLNMVFNSSKYYESRKDSIKELIERNYYFYIGYNKTTKFRLYQDKAYFSRWPSQIITYEQWYASV